MTHEIETKVLDVDTAAILTSLEELGAKRTKTTRLIVDWYRPKGSKESDARWFLRIRSNSEGVYEVTWKAKSQILGTARKHKEINFLVAEPEKLADLFEELGLEKYAHQEKDRTSYSLKEWKFDIDQYPHMSALLEIEGTSEAHVQEAIQILGLENNHTWAKGERLLVQEIYKLDWYDMKF
ncbi:MAG TPA: CYTH domain-containing protein [Candidatus Paceibacterota bacterium]|nr:CYTH domain-containing protein [Candidatus Paceibacterota bacterium]